MDALNQQKIESLKKMNGNDLKEAAKALNISGYGSMPKAKLLEACIVELGRLSTLPTEKVNVTVDQVPKQNHSLNQDQAKQVSSSLDEIVNSDLEDHPKFAKFKKGEAKP